MNTVTKPTEKRTLKESEHEAESAFKLISEHRLRVISMSHDQVSAVNCGLINNTDPPSNTGGKR